MLKELQLVNFQSHKNTNLVFDPGFNCIVGPSDNGKSVIIRAINWIRTNRPKGSDFSHGNTKYTDVRLIEWCKDRLGGCLDIRQEKNPNTRRCYSLRVATNGTLNILQQCFDYLIIKKEQALVAFKFRETFGKFYNRRVGLPESILKEREELYLEMKNLHHIKAY